MCYFGLVLMWQFQFFVGLNLVKEELCQAAGHFVVQLNFLICTFILIS